VPARPHTPRVIVVMGVSGCGKSTVGRTIASALGWRFLDADDFHSKDNVEKMSRGVPLSDADRDPWLHRLRREIDDLLGRCESGVLACSALKQRYRHVLRDGIENHVPIVFLDAEPDVLRTRLDRPGHFMPARLLDSQFAALERPTDALQLDATQPIGTLVRTAMEALELPGP
jgi:gluconokinase